ncbi:O-antigen ligase family protein [Flexistipes sinusarabici]|nr:O-antigen ligase family protein [Flexistipes sinusarabici]
MKSKIFFISFVVILFVIGDLQQEYPNFFVRYFKYMIFIVPFTYLLVLKKTNLMVQTFFYPFIFLIFWNVMFSPFSSLLNFRSLVVFIVPLLFFSTNLVENIYEKSLIKISIPIVIYFLIFKSQSAVNESLYDTLLSMNSSGAESFLLPFLLGFFAIFYFLINRYKLSFLFLAATLLSAKRSVIIACIAVILLSFFVPKKSNKKSYLLLGLLLNFITIFVLFLFINGFFDGYLESFLGVKSIGAFTSGRFSIYTYVFNNFYDLSLWNKLTGIGYGEISFYIGNYFNKGAWNSHSEVLRLMTEIGIIGSFIFITLLYNVRNKNQFLLTFFFNMLMVFTNILTYPVAMFLYLMMMYYFYNYENNKINKQVFHKLYVLKYKNRYYKLVSTRCK